MNTLPEKPRIRDDCGYSDNKQSQKYKEPQINTDEHRYRVYKSVFICVHLWLINFFSAVRKIGGSYEQ